MLSDVEIISEFMEARPPAAEYAVGSQWWRWLSGPNAILYICEPLEMLGRLHEVESRLNDKQWLHYGVCCWKWYTEAETANDYEISHLNRWRRLLMHLSPEQKIKALAAVLRPVVEVKEKP